VTLYLHKNLLGDLIYRLLHKCCNVAELNKAEAVPATYRLYIESFSYLLCNATKGNNAWYRINPTSPFN
jgi:hypothetical protein